MEVKVLNLKRWHTYCAVMLAVVIMVMAVFSVVSAADTVYVLPEPTRILKPARNFEPVSLKAVTIDPDDPCTLRFTLSKGDSYLNKYQLKKESERLIKMFLAALTVPSEQLWVNLSPYEKDRIISDDVKLTGIGSTMLAQDYILKQLSSSFTYPYTETGRAYWGMENRELKIENGLTQISNIESLISTEREALSKIWIRPDKAEIYENGNTAVLGRRSLLVNSPRNSCLIPEVTEQVNSGKHFAGIRQMYDVILLAVWYKKKILSLKQSNFDMFTNGYLGRIKTLGIEGGDIKDKVYSMYCMSFEKGVYDLTRPVHGSENRGQQKSIRRFFSGGCDFVNIESVPEIKKGSSSVAAPVDIVVKLKPQGRKPSGREIDLINSELAARYRVCQDNVVAQENRIKEEILAEINRVIADLSASNKVLEKSGQVVAKQILKRHMENIRTLAGYYSKPDLYKNSFSAENVQNLKEELMSKEILFAYELASVIAEREKIETELLKNNITLVAGIANKYYKRYNDGIMDFDDYMEEGMQGFLTGLRKFEPSLGNKLSTYVVWWIKQKIIRSYMNSGRMIRLPEYMFKLLFKVNFHRKKVLNDVFMGVLADDIDLPGEITKRMLQEKRDKSSELEQENADNRDLRGFNDLADKVNSILDLAFKISTVSLNSRLNAAGMDGGDGLTYGNIIENPSEDSFYAYLTSDKVDLMFYQTRKELYEKLTATLSPVEKKCLIYRYGLNESRIYTLIEAGEMLGVSRTRIGQITDVALRKIHARAVKLFPEAAGTFDAEKFIELCRFNNHKTVSDNVVITIEDYVKMVEEKLRGAKAASSIYEKNENSVLIDNASRAQVGGVDFSMGQQDPADNRAVDRYSWLKGFSFEIVFLK